MYVIRLVSTSWEGRFFNYRREGVSCCKPSVGEAEACLSPFGLCTPVTTKLWTSWQCHHRFEMALPAPVTAPYLNEVQAQHWCVRPLPAGERFSLTMSTGFVLSVLFGNKIFPSSMLTNLYRICIIRWRSVCHVSKERGWQAWFPQDLIGINRNSMCLFFCPCVPEERHWVIHPIGTNQASIFGITYKCCNYLNCTLHT